MISLARLLAFVALTVTAHAADKLLVVSVDGLDQRYLDRRDELRLRIPNIRRLLREGQASKGVVGIFPTVTWPSHTTIISGTPAFVHGIRANRRPASEGGDYYWSATLLKSRTLLDAARAAGKKTAAITWPVTVDAPLDFNLPEYFRGRRGGAMDLRSIASKAVPPGLAERIAAKYPSFGQEWMDDRTRTLATMYLLEVEKPDLMLVHLVDLDSEAHDNGPFTPEAIAILEYTDELIGRMLQSIPAGYAFALVSDHGFERTEQVVNLRPVANGRGVEGVDPMGGILVARTAEAKKFIEALGADRQYGIGRLIPAAELARFAPDLAKSAAVWESAPGFQFGSAATGELIAKPHEPGNHGHWPTRYRSVYVVAGKGIRPESLPELDMTSLAERLAAIIGLRFQPGPPMQGSTTPALP